jgi:hypothetical protein
MYIKHFEIDNFRKLKTVRVDFAKDKTVFVGANNSGKTSAMVALRRFLVDSSSFSINDLTLSNWKTLNSLINKIRESVDHQLQKARADSTEGHVRMFVLRSDTVDKPAAERVIAQHMSELTGEVEWNEPDGSKRLILEHRMAAHRMGFLDMFVPLYDVDDFKTGLLDGTLSITRFFSHVVLPLTQQKDDKFAIAKIIRAVSPLVTAEKLRESDDQPKLLRLTQEKLESLLSLWKNNTKPTRPSRTRSYFTIPASARWPDRTRGERHCRMPSPFSAW